MDHGQDVMTIVDENGNEIVCKVVLTFDSPQPEVYDRSYVVYHPVEAEDEEEESIEIYAAAFNPSDGEGGELFAIESEEEWNMVEEVIGAFVDEQEEEE